MAKSAEWGGDFEMVAMHIMFGIRVISISNTESGFLVCDSLRSEPTYRVDGVQTNLVSVGWSIYIIIFSGGQ